MKYRWAHALIAVAVLAGTPGAQADDTPAPFADGTKPVYCAGGTERMLPGDYYGCRALYHMQRKHYRQALEMLEESAYWANKEAQHQLGLAYINGDLPGIPANPPLGMAWLALARERHQDTYERDYALAVARSTPAQREQAGPIYLQLRKRYGDAVAGKRATDRFNREMRDIDEAARLDGEVMLDGYGPFPMRAYTISRQLHTQAESDFAGLQGSVLIGPLQRVQDRVDTATLGQHPGPGGQPAASGSAARP